MNEPNWKELREKFPKELITPVHKAGGMVDTLNHAVVTDRLIRHGGDWTYSKPEPVTVVGGDGMPHVVAIVASMTIGGITRWETGGPERMSNYTQELKESISDFVKRAAMRFGVGLDLWSKADLDHLDGTTAAVDEGGTAAQNRHEDAGPSTEGPGTQQGADAGEGTPASEESSASQRFIGGREANALQKALGGKALEVAQEAYGTEIQVLTDLTWEQARDLVAVQR